MYLNRKQLHLGKRPQIEAKANTMERAEWKVQARYMTWYKHQRESSNSRTKESLCKQQTRRPKSQKCHQSSLQAQEDNWCSSGWGAL